eukprot:833337_1
MQCYRVHLMHSLSMMGIRASLRYHQTIRTAINFDVWNTKNKNTSPLRDPMLDSAHLQYRVTVDDITSWQLFETFKNAADEQNYNQFRCDRRYHKEAFGNWNGISALDAPKSVLKNKWDIEFNSDRDNVTNWCT